MKGRLLILGLVAWLVSGPAHLDAQTASSRSIITTSAAQNYPAVTCTTSDDLACANALQMAVDARDQLRSLLGLGRAWRFPVHIHVLTPDDPLTEKINREAAAVFATGETMKIEAVLPIDDPEARVFLQRQYVTALLWEKFFANTTSFDTQTKLDVVPLWLIEGLREWLNEDPEHNRESIVRRAVQLKTAPSLQQVTSWTQISNDRLMGMWQRSFCFYLVNSLIRPGERREDFQTWMATLAGPKPGSASLLFPTEGAWQNELAAAGQRSRAVVYSWDETVAELTAADIIEVPGDKPDKTKLATLDNIATFPRDPKLVEVLKKKVFDLTNLELRAHPSWRPILELYRFGLTAIINNEPMTKITPLFRLARDERVAEIEYHQKLVDYINWFEVTQDLQGRISPFQAYFMTAEEMKKVVGDPKHPNPLRQNLREVESQL